MELEELLVKYCETEPALLKKIDRETQLHVLMPRMLSGHFQGRVLSFLSKMLNPKNILEIGTFTGYATLCLAEGLDENGQITTIDINEELEERVRGYFEESAYSEKINYLIGDAMSIAKDINKTWDLVFIDADKKNNGNYYDLIFDKVRPGGLIIVDNVLWSGKILAEAKDTDTKNINNFNNKINEDQRVEKLILPVRDGLFIIRKK
ncbi:O-methyltransferase [Pedobacter flavus]|uniref:O-methyltransferase n=1 Tax=Pedobacter flavus TaxID=3113906 RepID=A0ABU7GZG6_9SPHI|nr:O-methyltransferase [Pedobacter sp. VNH31]MEE1884399.1 O-methyltransferase [Pedobacter sp. VNH31]